MKRCIQFILLFLLFQFPVSAQQITGYIYLDDNADGQLTGFEGGMSGVRVLLYKDDGDGVFDPSSDVLTSTQLTDIQGIYNFDLRASATFGPTDDDDDAEEDFDGDMSRSSSDLEMMQEDNLQNAVGIRFRNISLTQGQAVRAAYITFTADESDDETTNLVLRGEDIDDSPTFSNTDFDITSRTTTSNSKPWSDIPAWSSGTTYESPDITSIIQEIVDRAGWSSGNDLSIIVTGTGKRVAVSYDGDEDEAPQLTVKYDNPSAVGTYFVTINNDDLLPGGSFTEPNASGVVTSVIGSATDSLSLQNIGYTGEAITCFIIPEDEDRLEVINRVSGNYEVTGALNSPNNHVEAISLDLNNNILYAMDADELGVIDLQTGEFISRGNSVGTGDGASGAVGFDDVDALSYDFNDDVLYGVQAESGRKLIIIDPATGLLVEDAFGAGVDYLEITGTGLLSEISDLTFAPSTGILYGINTSSSQSQIIQINKTTGAATVVTNVTFGGDNLEDIEALAFTIYNTDTIYVTTGTEGDDDNSFFSVDLNTGVATDISASTPLSGSDYESCDCFFKAIPSLIEYNPLPLNLIKFSGEITASYNEIYWETVNEINFSHFEIYKSFTGKNFKKIAETSSKGNNTSNRNRYFWKDEKHSSRVYYKLKMIDEDGSYEWSRIISMSSKTEDSAPLALSLYPNPATSRVNISLTNTHTLEEGTIALYDSNGQLLHTSKMNLGLTSESVINTSNLANGVYVVRVMTRGKVLNQKLVVSH